MRQGLNADLAQVLTGGYSGFANSEGSRGFIDGEPNIAALREQFDSKLESYGMARNIFELFSSPLGQKVLQYFKNQSLMCVQFNPLEPNPAESGFFRAGEANWVLHILNAMKKAEAGPPEMPPELQAAEGEQSDE